MSGLRQISLKKFPSLSLNRTISSKNAAEVTCKIINVNEVPRVLGLSTHIKLNILSLGRIFFTNAYAFNAF